MKRSLLLIVTSGLILFFSSCKKYLQKQAENQAVSIMTNGYWFVSGYKQNDSDITAAFSGYLFKFDADNTVTGTKGNVSVTGQWSDNIVARTITANFPGAVAPVVYLNETWTIKDSYTDSVSAKCTDTVNHTINILQLKKQ